MKNHLQISDAELEVMKILWELETATSPQIIEKLSESTRWNPKTIHTLLSRLVTKGAVKAERIDKRSYIYKAQIIESEYKNQESHSFLKRMFDGSLNLMLTSYVKEQKLTKDEINELKKLLEDEVEK